MVLLGLNGIPLFSAEQQLVRHTPKQRDAAHLFIFFIVLDVIPLQIPKFGGKGNVFLRKEKNIGENIVYLQQK